MLTPQNRSINNEQAATEENSTAANGPTGSFPADSYCLENQEDRSRDRLLDLSLGFEVDLELD